MNYFLFSVYFLLKDPLLLFHLRKKTTYNRKINIYTVLKFDFTDSTSISQKLI